MGAIRCEAICTRPPFHRLSYVASFLSFLFTIILFQVHKIKIKLTRKSIKALYTDSFVAGKFHSSESFARMEKKYFFVKISLRREILDSSVRPLVG